MNNPNAAAGLSRNGRIVITLICAAVVGFYFWRCGATVSELGRDRGADQYYNLLVAGFEAGQLSLRADVPEGLKQLPDPYDPAANAPYRKYQFAPLTLHDTSYYRGKLYLYFGVTPALVLFWPFHLLTGGWLTHSNAVAIFCGVGFLIGVWLLSDMARRYFANARTVGLPAAVLAFGFANSVSVMMWRADVWEVPIACAYLFIMIALAAIWRALHDPARRRLWVAAASVAYGLAIGARPSVLFGAVVLLVPVIVAWRQHGPERRTSLLLPLLLAIIVPLAVMGAGLALYNQLRFGNPFEFGQRYQLAGDRQDSTHHFSVGYFWYNFRLYFLSLAPWRETFPFLRNVAVPVLPEGHGDVDMPCGILTNMPFTLFAAGASLLWRPRKVESGVPMRWFVGALASFFGLNAALLCLFYGTCTRYQVEFHPYLVLMAGIGLLAIDTRTCGVPRWRVGVTALALGCLGYSAVFGVLKSFQGMGENFNARGVARSNQGDLEGALRYFEQAIRYAPDRLDPRFYAAVTSERLGRMADAIVYYEALVRIAPHHAIAQNNLSQLLRQTGRRDEAIAHFQAALRVRPDFFEAYFNLGSTFQDAGRPADAVECFRRAAALRPEFAEAHYELAVSLRAVGRLEEAKAEYAAARRLKPTLPELAF